MHTVSEGDGPVNALDGALRKALLPIYPRLAELPLGGTAVGGVNYSGVTASPLVIPAGQTTGTISGTMIDDGKYDTTNKTLSYTLNNPMQDRLIVDALLWLGDRDQKTR